MEVTKEDLDDARKHYGLYIRAFDKTQIWNEYNKLFAIKDRTLPQEVHIQLIEEEMKRRHHEAQKEKLAGNPEMLKQRIKDLEQELAIMKAGQ